jgi:hypothetical protein
MYSLEIQAVPVKGKNGRMLTVDFNSGMLFNKMRDFLIFSFNFYLKNENALIFNHKVKTFSGITLINYIFKRLIK